MKSAPFIMDFFNYPGADSNDPLSINAMFENFDQDVSDELEELLQCTVTEKLGAHFGLRTPPAATDFALANSPTHNIAMCGSLNNNNNNIKLNNNNLTSTTGSSNNKTANNEFMANGFASGLNATNASLADANNSHAQPMYNNATTISVTNTTATGNILRGVDIAGLLQLTEDHRSNVWTANVSEQTVPRTTSVSTPTLTAISDLAVDSRIRNRTSLGSLTSNTNGNIHVNGSNPRVFVDHLKETENANPNLQVNQRPGLAVSRHHGRDQPVKQCTAVLLGTVGQLSKNGLMQGAQHHSINSPLNSGLHSHNNNSRGQPSPSQQHQNENTATTTLSPIFLLQSCPQQTHLQQQQQQQQRILQESEQIKQQGIMGNIYQHSQNILQNIAIQPMETSDFSCETNEGPQRTLGHHRTTLHPTVDTSALADTLTCEDLLREGQMGDKNYPKPVYSYSCLIAMALKNSKAGSLPVSEIYNFMIENFPYFKNAPGGWKNSVRHNLSLNKCFEKVDNPKLAGTSRKGCLWALNPAKIPKMEEEIAKWEKKDPQGIRNSMAKPERLEMIVQGRACSRHISHELTNIIVSSTNNRIEHPGALTTTVNHLDIKSSILSNLQNNDYSHHHNQQQQQQQQQHLEMMESSQHQHLNQHHNHHQLTPSKIEEMLGISLKDVNTLETRNFTLDSELALKGSLWDEDLNLELSVDIPLSSVSTNGSLQSLNTLATSAPHINLYSPLTGIRTDSLMSTGFGHTAYG